MVDAIYDDESERVSDIEVYIVEISPENARIIGGVACVFVGQNHNYGCPIENFLDVPDLTEDDTHDLRSRWFATREEAEGHAEAVKELWARPNPWTAFVKL